MNVTNENVVDVHKRTMQSVYDNNYYVNIFDTLKGYYSGIENSTNFRQIVEFWDDFWCQLPDTTEIRRVPFFDICDIAENIFELEPNQ